MPANVDGVRWKAVVVERALVDKFKITMLQRGARCIVLNPSRRRDPPLGSGRAYVRDELPERGGHDSLAQRGRFPDHPIDGDGIFQSEDAGPVRVLGRGAELDEPNWRVAPLDHEHLKWGCAVDARPPFGFEKRDVGAALTPPTLDMIGFQPAGEVREVSAVEGS